MLPVTAAGPGEGPHWERLAEWLRERIPAEGVDGVWVFRVLRRDQREFGTAVISQVEGDRRRISTARYAAIIKGKQRGGFETWIEEVGSGPLEALHELLALVPVLVWMTGLSLATVASAAAELAAVLALFVAVCAADAYS